MTTEPLRAAMEKTDMKRRVIWMATLASLLAVSAGSALADEPGDEAEVDADDEAPAPGSTLLTIPVDPDEAAPAAEEVAVDPCDPDTIGWAPERCRDDEAADEPAASTVHAAGLPPCPDAQCREERRMIRDLPRRRALQQHAATHRSDVVDRSRHSLSYEHQLWLGAEWTGITPIVGGTDNGANEQLLEFVLRWRFHENFGIEALVAPVGLWYKEEFNPWAGRVAAGGMAWVPLGNAGNHVITFHLDLSLGLHQNIYDHPPHPVAFGLPLGVGYSHLPTGLFARAGIEVALYEELGVAGALSAGWHWNVL